MVKGAISRLAIFVSDVAQMTQGFSTRVKANIAMSSAGCVTKSAGIEHKHDKPTH